MVREVKLKLKLLRINLLRASSAISGGTINLSNKKQWKITSFAFSSYQKCDCLPGTGHKAPFQGSGLGVRQKFTPLFLLVPYLWLHNG